MSVFILLNSVFILYYECMKNNLSRGSVGSVILIIVGIILCLLLLGVMVKTFQNSSFSEGFIPSSTVNKNSTSTSSSTSSNSSTVSSPSNDFVPSTASCQMIISEPDDADNVSNHLYFEGYLSGCGTVTSGMLIGSVTLYKYGTSEAVGSSLTIRSSGIVRSGPVNFSGYLEIPSDIRIEKGVLKFKHFLPQGGSKNIDRIVYF